MLVARATAKCAAGHGATDNPETMTLLPAMSLSLSFNVTRRISMRILCLSSRSVALVPVVSLLALRRVRRVRSDGKSAAQRTHIVHQTCCKSSAEPTLAGSGQLSENREREREIERDLGVARLPRSARRPTTPPRRPCREPRRSASPEVAPCHNTTNNNHTYYHYYHY